MARVELVVSIRVDPDGGGGMGIAADAEELVNDITYYGNEQTPVAAALLGAVHQLELAIEDCRRRAVQV